MCQAVGINGVETGSNWLQREVCVLPPSYIQYKNIPAFSAS